MNSKTDLFLDKYRQLELLVATTYHLRNSESPVVYLTRRPEFRDITGELEYCREVRNLLSHNPKVGDCYAVEPGDGMIALLDRVLEQVRHPRQAKHIWVPRERVYCCTLKDRVRPAMQRMQEKCYTHVPIVRNGTVTGVFSENTLLMYLLDHDTVQINDQLHFSELADYLPLNRHRAETFRFVRPDTPVTVIEDLFAEAAKKQERIGMIFVTGSGNANGRLLGIISPQDAAAID
jgi:CBS domain-containing protein